MVLLTQRATLDDLYRVEGKAELIDGKVVEIMASGDIPGTTASEIYFRLRDHTKRTKRGRAYADGVGFGLPAELESGRESFCPDAAFIRNPIGNRTMRFLEVPPDFAVEVRSENDYGNDGELEMAAKRADYFEAGTLVVWDVDPIDETISCYVQNDPTNARIFRRGDLANAEPAVPGWQMDVAELFDDAKA